MDDEACSARCDTLDRTRTTPVPLTVERPSSDCGGDSAVCRGACAGVEDTDTCEDMLPLREC